MDGVTALYKECVTTFHSTDCDDTRMAAIYHPLLALIASVTDRHLARYVEFLKEENKILRTRIKGQVHTRPDERRRLLQLGKTLGQGIEEIITLVTPATFYRWIRDENEPEMKRPKGGSRKPREIRELVLEIAATTSFGYTRILGELRKLGVRKISRQTVRNILKEAGIEPRPNRTSDSWDNFLKRHAETLWAVDFFSVKTLTTRGLRTTYLMAFLCLETREAIVSKSTQHPNSAWVVRQTKEFLAKTKDREKKPDILMHDRDSKFSRAFTAACQQGGLRTNPLPIASPNLNGRCERFIQTIKHELLFKFILFGNRHLDYLVQQFLAYYNGQRAHMERANLPPLGEIPEEVEKPIRNRIEINSYVGGLVKSFERKAA
ncbi:Integrase core domain protein [Caulifigura coniformis]|uniref:Integrase core domain protein n=2 Tax=Caulifigura coniformis TaxID=2527983 RepID=A0A517SCN5_9PLAN|nr:Integrase core domain protein [Caulifigura coniformis]